MNNDTQSRYQQAQALSQGQLTTNIIKNDVILPHWINDSKSFWYVRNGEKGREFVLVNAKDAAKGLVFNHEILADQLHAATGLDVDSNDLPLSDLIISLSPTIAYFQAFDKQWQFNTEESKIKEIKSTSNDLHYAQDGVAPIVLDKHGLPEALLSPDGKLAVFVRDYNLWLRDTATGKDRALTTNGSADQGYGITGGFDSAVQARWSPDSKRLLTVQLNTQGGIQRPFVSFAPEDGTLNPQVTRVAVSYPGDEKVSSYQLFWIVLETGEVHFVDYAVQPSIPSGCSSWGFFSNNLGWWSTDSRRAFFIDVTRSADTVRLVELDTQTGLTRVLFEETSDTMVNLCPNFFDFPLFLPLPDSDELIWYSERSGWGQLYLYDLTTGELKHQITGGEPSANSEGWLVRDVVQYDQKKRELIIQTAGRDPDINPYYRDICKVNIDTCELTTLLSDNIDHTVTHPRHLIVLGLREKSPALVVQGAVNGVSPSGEFIVTSRSRVDTPTSTVLLDRNGREIMVVETADVSNLPEGWVWPEPVMMKDAEGNNELYGVIYRPPGFSVDKSYPVIDYAWTMRGAGTVPVGAFHLDTMIGYTYTLSTALAALGFIVVSIEGRGTPFRGKQFQDYYADDIAGEHVLDDHVAGIKQLAQRDPSMDLSRVGIVAAEQSPFAVYGAVHHSDFFKVAVQHCFADPRYGLAGHGEMHFNHSQQIDDSNNGLGKIKHIEDFVGSLNAKLLLIQGMLSFAVGSTFGLVEALQKANKDFDMICLPNMTHQMTGYTIRREWDYMIKHLQGIEPPKEFSLTVGEETITENLESSTSEFLEMMGGTTDEKQPA